MYVVFIDDSGQKGKRGGMGDLIGVGVIALLIFAPNVLGWIVSKIPSLATLLGITSIRVIGNVVKGVQKVRKEFRALPDDVPLTKAEVLKRIKNGLESKSDEETENTVVAIKKKYKLESASE